MPFFVVLGKWTDQGIRNIKDSPERAKKSRSMWEKAGGKIQLYFTLGEYDFVGIIELPNDEELAKILLCLGSMGTIRTVTMKAWAEADFMKMLSGEHSMDTYLEKPTTGML
jgi:uncharacterized protein with GYD domain